MKTLVTINQCELLRKYLTFTLETYQTLKHSCCFMQTAQIKLSETVKKHKARAGGWMEKCEEIRPATVSRLMWEPANILHTVLVSLVKSISAGLTICIRVIQRVHELILFNFHRQTARIKHTVLQLS